MMKIDLRQNADDSSKDDLDADILADNSTINRNMYMSTSGTGDTSVFTNELSGRFVISQVERPVNTMRIHRKTRL
jgi:hypothetical protein